MFVGLSYKHSLFDFRSSFRERRLTTSFAIIAVTLISMYLPQLILKPLILNKSGGLHRIPVSLEDIANTLLYCNSFINPLIYAFRHQGLKKEIKSMFGCIVNCRSKESEKSLNVEARVPQCDSMSSSTEQTPTSRFTPSPRQKAGSTYV